MPSRRATPVNVHGIIAKLKAISFRDDRLWSWVNGKMITCVNGEGMSASEFDQRFPVPPPITFYHQENNPDKTKTYLT